MWFEIDRARTEHLFTQFIHKKNGKDVGLLEKMDTKR